jgi:hypothetical protein
MAEYTLRHFTNEGTSILVSKGSKKESVFDFKVHFQEKGGRKRTPKHIHIIVDLYIKLSHNEKLTLQLIDHIIDLINNLKPAKEYPPTLQLFDKNTTSKFNELNKYGQYSVEFILVVIELIMIQEKTNYPNGTLNLMVFKKFRDNHEDIFSVVQAATFTNR